MTENDTTIASGDPRKLSLEPAIEPAMNPGKPAPGPEDKSGRGSPPIKPDPTSPGTADPPVREPINPDPTTPADSPVREPRNPNPTTPGDAPVREPINPDPTTPDPNR